MDVRSPVFMDRNGSRRGQSRAQQSEGEKTATAKAQPLEDEPWSNLLILLLMGRVLFGFFFFSFVVCDTNMPLYLFLLSFTFCLILFSLFCSLSVDNRGHREEKLESTQYLPRGGMYSITKLLCPLSLCLYDGSLRSENNNNEDTIKLTSTHTIQKIDCMGWLVGCDACSNANGHAPSPVNDQWIR